MVLGTRGHLWDQDLLMLQERCCCAVLLLLGRVVRDTSLPAELQRAGLVLSVIFQLASFLGLLDCLFPAPLPLRGLGWPVTLLTSYAGRQGRQPGDRQLHDAATSPSVTRLSRSAVTSGTCQQLASQACDPCVQSSAHGSTDPWGKREPPCFSHRSRTV